MNTEWTIDEEAAALHKRFDDLKIKGIGQAEFARKWQVKGGASMVSQHIKARRPISLEAAIAYASGFGCQISDISPRLAKTVLTITTPNVKWSLESESSKQNSTLAHIDSAPVATKEIAELAQITKALSGYFESMDASTRKMAVGLIGQLADDPQDHARIAAMIELSIHSKRQKAA
jgi:hypothetical protein